MATVWTLDELVSLARVNYVLGRPLVESFIERGVLVKVGEDQYSSAHSLAGEALHGGQDVDDVLAVLDDDD